ncbi:cobalamin-dependent protein [Alkalihalobacillus sp. LMS39]|uniref:cobalamin B12-binding domain-containing protein n=1 Tax=Alkalihalobacillus sp. LMS39 TaxID=2924032 RepID=UPI001FB24473|nr:cobalamin-dependent protein [Alkalihalobacillus sp. LMS39]UOE92616.1 cobalamin-dependent protein [Alkalihalobacillus sp. LMS39]
MYDYARHLAMEFLKGDHFTSWSLIQQQIDDGMSSYFIFDYVLRDAMFYIGHMWENNEIGVADEHLATSICDYVLTRYNFDRHPLTNREKRAMFFCVEGEEHYLGAKMASSLFQEAGWDVKYLGPNLPLEYALFNAKKWRPDVIGLSITLPLHLPKLKDYVYSLEHLPHRPKVIVGSRLIEKYDFTPFISNQTVLAKEVTDIEPFIEQYLMKVIE